MPPTEVELKTPEDARAEIDRRRDELTSSAVALRERVQTLTDWHHWVDEAPWALVGGAFALGFVIAYRAR